MVAGIRVAPNVDSSSTGMLEGATTTLSMPGDILVVPVPSRLLTMQVLSVIGRIIGFAVMCGGLYWFADLYTTGSLSRFRGWAWRRAASWFLSFRDGPPSVTLRAVRGRGGSSGGPDQQDTDSWRVEEEVTSSGEQRPSQDGRPPSTTTMG